MGREVMRSAAPRHEPFAALLLACVAAAVLATASGGPVVRLHYDLAASERQAALHAVGAMAADLCATGEGHANHACPLCHKLPGADPVAAHGLVRPAVLVIHAKPCPADAPGQRVLAAHAPTRAPPASGGHTEPGLRETRTT
jgi:hypothetical protein